MWQPQVEALSDAYRVIALDLPGHGALAGETFTFDGAVARLHDVVAAEADGPALVVGISLGGHVATAWAHRHPDQVAGLVLSGASMNFTGALALYTRVVGYAMLKLLSERWLRRQLARSIRRNYPLDQADRLVQAGLYPRGVAASFLGLAGTDFRAMLATVTAPVLLLNGEQDRANRKHAAEFAAVCRAQVEIIRDAGHFCSQQQPEVFASAVRRFAEASVYALPPE